MSLLNSGPSTEIPLSTDGLTHMSTLASSSTASNPVEWKKSSPLKTYSKKTPVILSPPLDAENDDKSRYGRARKFIQSGDFLSTDKKVSQYLKIQSEYQLHNYRVTYSNPKARSVRKKPKTPQLSAPPILGRSFSMACLPKAATKADTLKTESFLDLAAPVCTETVETPLPLQQYESDSDSDAMTPQDYSVGDLVWAAIPTYPYWPAIITRDPVTSLPYKMHGFGNSSRVHWHVNFFGDKGMRGWVITPNTFIFDGLESYNKAKADCLSNISHLSKAKKKTLLKPYTIPETYGTSWLSAVSEAQSLLDSSRSDRLEHLISTYAPKVETLKKRQRSLSICDLSMIPKKQRLSEPPMKRKSAVTRTKKALELTSKYESIKSLEVSSPPKTAKVILPKLPKASDERSLTENPDLPSTPARDAFAITPDSALETLDEPSLSETPKRSKPKRKSMETKSAQTDRWSSLKSVLTKSHQPQTSKKNSTALLDDVPDIMKRRNVRSKKVPVTFSAKPAPMKSNKPLSVVAQDSTFAPLEDARGLTASGKPKKKLGRPRKEPSILKEPALKKPSPLVEQRASLPPQGESLYPVKRLRGRPRKTSLPTPSTVEPLNVATETPLTKFEGLKSTQNPSTPIITRAGRKSNKPIMLSMLSSTRSTMQGPKTENRLSPSGLVKQEPVSSTRGEIEPMPSTISPAPKRKRLSVRKMKKTIKMELDAECSLDDTPVKYEKDSKAKTTTTIKENPRTQLSKKISLFAGVKDGKMCSICFKPGQSVRRCRGPCSLYMHEECSDKPRFVPDCNTAQEGPQCLKKKNGKRLVTDMRKTCLGKLKEELSNEGADSSNGLEKNPTAPEMSIMELRPVNGMKDDSVSATDSEVDKVEIQTGHNSPANNGISDDSGLYDAPTKCDQLRLDPVKGVEKSGSCFDNICRFNGKSTNQNLEQEELVLHLSEQDSFPESSGIPTPPPEDITKSPDPKTTDGVCRPIKLEPVDDELGILEIKVEPGNCPIDSAESLTSDASEKDKNDTSKKEGKDKGWVCNMCQEGKLGPCFACGKDDGERVRCKATVCGKVFHLECTKDWPQHTMKHTASGKLIFNCPAHTCHTCISDNPASLTSRYLNDKLVRCMRCPTTYHHGNFCVPAGSEILTSTQIICPRHFRQGKKSLKPVNASWCFLCSMGGSLICCDLCPNSFHVECLKISPPEGAYICEDCETGRFPLYGEIVWAKLGNYRWWPARILFPLEIPVSLQRVDHVPGEFVVKFYGTYNYYWLHRGRVFLFHDGDGQKQDSITLHSKKHSESVFSRGVEEANSDFITLTRERNQREETQRTSLKPPKYIKITSNKPVGSVKMNEADASSLTACDCKPDQKDPCGPESDCINRLLLVECSPQICPAGEKCNNKNFEKRLYPPLAPFRTDYRGWGLKTLGPLKKGDFIIEYVGEMIEEDEYKRRLHEMQRSKDENFYFLTLDKDRMLDAGPKGNLSRFMNHSCLPNCETQKWTVEGNTRVGLFALQDIPADKELVFNYNLMTTGDNKLECRCGAPTCAGYIGGKPTKPPPKPKDDATSSKLRNSRQRAKKKKRTRKKNLTKLALTNSLAIGALSKVPSTKEEIKCYACHEVGATVACQDPSCPQQYHLSCLGLSKDPSKKWTCPWHECSVCGSRNKVENCSLCINAYCTEHQEGNLVLNRGKGSLCHNHNMSDSGSDWSTGEKDDESADCRIPLLETNTPSRRQFMEGP